jgi:hypothetical protein
MTADSTLTDMLNLLGQAIDELIHARRHKVVDRLISQLEQLAAEADCHSRALLLSEVYLLRSGASVYQSAWDDVVRFSAEGLRHAPPGSTAYHILACGLIRGEYELGRTQEALRQYASAIRSSIMHSHAREDLGNLILAGKRLSVEIEVGSGPYNELLRCAGASPLTAKAFQELWAANSAQAVEELAKSIATA